MSASAIVSRVVDHSRSRGLTEVVRTCASWGARWAAGRAQVGRPWSESFTYDGVQYPCLRHAYNWTWLNERAVEVPLGSAVLAAAGAGRVLEVGNVMAHYQPVSHTVVDKFERAPGVLNVDVVDLELPDRFDLIVSISTLEHVGFDESPKEPGKPARAIARLAGMLAPGGRLWVTIPVGYNDALDADLQADRLGFTRLTALRHDPASGHWQQIPVDEVWGTSYDWLVYTARAIVVGELVAPGGPAGA
jgi:SAM-dependent methyltransferase